MPTGEFELAKLVVKHVIPGISDEALAASLAHRHSVKQPRMEATLTAEDIAEAADILGEADAETMRKEAADYQKKIGKLLASARAAGLPSGRAKKLKKIPTAAFVTKGALRKYMPDIGGANLAIETKWQTRWRVEYRKKGSTAQANGVSLQSGRQG